MKNIPEFKKPVRIEISQTKVLAIFTASVLFFAAALLLWKQNTLDSAIVVHFNYVYNSENLIGLVKILSKYGMPFIVAIYAFLLFLLVKNEELRQTRPVYFLILISFFLSTLGGDLVKEIIDKARPVISLAGQVAITNVAETSAFPSGHAAKSMALALPFVLLMTHKNNIVFVSKFLLLFAAVLVCFSRIAQQAHYLSDVLAGIGTALFFIPVALWLTNSFYLKMKIDEAKLGKLSKKFVFIFIAFAVLLCFL